MISKPSHDHLDALLRAITFPTESTARREVLITLHAILPRDYDRRAVIGEMIQHLRAEETMQLRLTLNRE